MHIIKLIFLLFLLPVLSQAKITYAQKCIKTEAVSKKVSDHHDVKFKPSAGHERFGRSKKIKQRGMGGVCPCISYITFGQLFTYKTYLFQQVEESYASFLYCVDCKRGPPARS